VTQTDDLEARIPDFGRSWSSEEIGSRVMGAKEKVSSSIIFHYSY